MYSKQKTSRIFPPHYKYRLQSTVSGMSQGSYKYMRLNRNKTKSTYWLSISTSHTSLKTLSLASKWFTKQCTSFI